MTRRQAGTMLHPEAQASAEHRIKHRGAHRIHPMSPVVSASRQSGLQLSAQSQHHLGASFSLAHSHYTDIVTVPPNNLKPVSTFSGGRSVWKRGGAYKVWEFFAPIAAQHGHVDELAAVIVRVPDHPPSHLPAAKARSWLAERTDATEDPIAAAAGLAAGPVYDVQRRRWYAKDATLPPLTNF